MAPPPSLHLPTSLLFIASLTFLLFSQTHSQNCTSSHSFNTTYQNCQDLPSLRANLHWTYDPSARPNPTLTIAFVAPPAKPDGWVSWALNPTGTGMVGAQALVAFKDTNGSLVVKTYNITAYGPITESKIAYNVLSRRAEHSGGVITIFATLAVPSVGPELNQVWQVGPSVRNGVPDRHEFAPANLNAKSTLQLNGNGPAAAPVSPKGNGNGNAPVGSPAGGVRNDKGGSSRVRLGLYGALVLFGVWVF